MGGGRTVTFHSSGEGEGMAKWGQGGDLNLLDYKYGKGRELSMKKTSTKFKKN